MNYFFIVQLLVQTLSVASYTVVLKQVKPLYPSVKVYRYEVRHAKVLPESNGQLFYSKPLLGQRIYPVAVKPVRDVQFKTRAPVKKEKGKLYKFSTTTEKPVVSRVLGLSQHLVPPVSNKIEEAKEEDIREDENDVRSLVVSPHSSSKSFSSFGQDKGRLYNSPGEWATPMPQVNSENSTKAEFTPSQLYLQIRHKNTVIHVPQSEALKDAETLEELINAPRLKQLSRTTHVQETYSEEGYEDAGYDHAGHLRQAQHGEVYDAKDEGRFQIKEAPIILDYDSDLEESKKVPLKNANDNLLPSEGNVIEPRITSSRSEVSKTSTEYAKIPKNYKGEHKYSSRVKSPIKNFNEKENEFDSGIPKEFPTVLSYFGETPPPPESVIANHSVISYELPAKKSSKYRKDGLNSTKIYPVSNLTDSISPVIEYTDFKPYISLIDSQASPSAKSLKYSRIYSKKTKQLRLEPYKNENIFSPPPPPPPPPPLLPTPSSNSEYRLQLPLERDKTEEEESINGRIVLPTIGYINSLTTAHFGKEASKIEQNESKSQLTDALNLTQALKYLRSKKNQQISETTNNPMEIDIRTFESMKLKKPLSFFNKTKRDVYVMGIREKRTGTRVEGYEGNEESDLPHDEKNEEISQDERKRIKEENLEKEKYEKDLKSEISKQEKEIIEETYKNIGVEDDVSEVFPEFPSSGTVYESSFLPAETTPTPVNMRKYPFYTSKRLPENSALRYATDPGHFPKKSGYKMEFYESRERLIQCPDFHPDLEDLPDSNSAEHSEEQPGQNQRLTGLGDKIACLRMKYFDPEPFDNPIFKEREIEYVGKHVKGQRKVQSKIIPKTLKSKKGGKKIPQKSSQSKSTNEKPNKNYMSPSYFDETTALPEIKTQPSVFVSPMSHVRTTQSIKIPTLQKIQNMPVPRQPIGWKTVYRPKHRPAIQNNPETTNRIVLFKFHKCLPHISQLVALDGINNVTVDCNDVILIQEVIKKVPYLKIIQKEKTNEKTQYSDQTDWVPIVGHTRLKHPYRSEKPLSRRTDQVTKITNETSQNSSSPHYVIDELKEDENVRKGEVVEDMAHYLKLMEDFKNETNEVTTVKMELKAENSRRRRRSEAGNGFIKPKKDNNFSKLLEFSLDKALQTQSSSKNEPDKTSGESNAPSPRPFQLKRPLKRLTGLDFLVRYHKNKGKHLTQKAQDFWKVTTQKPIIDINEKESEEIIMLTTTKSTDNKTTETAKKYFVNEASEFRKRQTKSTSGKFNKTTSEQTTEFQKVSPLNLIPQKIPKSQPGKTSEVLKITSQSSISEKTTTKPVTFTKIVTKVTTVTGETSEKPGIIYKQTRPHLKQNFHTAETPVGKKEPLQYKTIDRSSNSFQYEDSRKPSESPQGSTLYYVVNLKTGRGKWITNYDEKLWSFRGKLQKPQRVKEYLDVEKDKTRKKNENF